MTAIRICGMENFTSATQSPRLALFSVTARFLLSPVLQTINSFCIKEWFNSLPNKKKNIRLVQNWKRLQKTV